MSNALMHARDAFLVRFPETRIALEGRDWGLIDTGQSRTGATLLFLPGTLGRADVFFQQIEALSRDCRVLALSYPATGGVPDWSASILALLDRLEIGQVAVLGSSLGGFLAQYLAGMAPGRVSHLFAANTLSSVAGVDRLPPYSSDLWAAPIDDLRAGFAAGMTAWKAAHPDHADMVDFLLTEAAGRIPEAEMRARLDAIKTGPLLPPLSRPAQTTTVIETEDDPLIPPPLRDAVRARTDPAPVFRFLWGGHFPYLLRPALYSGVIKARLGLAGLSEEWRRDGGVFVA